MTKDEILNSPTLFIANEMFGDIISFEDLSKEAKVSEIKTLFEGARSSMIESLKIAHKKGDKLKVTKELADKVIGWLATLGRAVNKVKTEDDYPGYKAAVQKFHDYFTGDDDITNSPFHKAMTSSMDRGMSDETGLKWSKDVKSLFTATIKYMETHLK